MAKMASKNPLSILIGPTGPKAPLIRWELVSGEDALPPTAYRATTINEVAQYIGRYEYKTVTIVGPIIKGTGLVLPVGDTAQVISKNFEVLLVGAGTVVEWKDLDANSACPRGYKPVQGSSDKRPPTLIGMVEGAGVGHVEVEDGGARKTCIVPLEDGTMETSDPSQFQILCIRL